MSYQHLTQSQRYQVATLHKGGFSSRHIAETAECHHSTVARQIWAMLAHEVDYDPCASVHHPRHQERVVA